ncbi:MAG: AraC family transcriptional regulator [Bacteroidota bacterium]
MHLRKQKAFNFIPGESLILPAKEMMAIDFPEASMDNPTKCLAMAIDPDCIDEVSRLMNENMPKVEGEEWGLMDYNFHFTNDIAIYQIIHRLLFLCTENHPSKDLFVSNMIRELIIRILQAESRKIHNEQSESKSGQNRLTFIIQYIKDHLDHPLTIEDLSKKAYMSESNFHRVFKNELGISPIDFINNERIKLATSLLQNPRIKIKEVYMRCGFNSLSYFNRVFKRKKQLAPKEYQLKVNQDSF